MKMPKKILTICILILAFSTTLSTRIRVRELCDLIGYTLIACTSISYDGGIRIRRPNDLIKLDNGMAFKITGIGPIGPIFGEKVAVFATKTVYAGEEVALYSLLIEGQYGTYTATRIK